jgi:general secretion pathway protein G
MKSIMRPLPRLASGFTLIEVMVVVVILGILASVVVPKIMDRPDKARQTRAAHDVRAIESALSLFKMDNFAYPSTNQGLEALVHQPSGDYPNWKKGGYLDQLPKDPWGRHYQYLFPGTHRDIDVYSLGADGRPGGEGMDADIGNWEGN